MEKYYQLLPIWLQNILVSLYGLTLKLSRKFKDSCKVEEIEFQNMTEYHEKKLEYALRKGAPRNERESIFEHYKNLPYTDKIIVRENLSSFQRNANNIIQRHTSGTTGAGLKFTTTKYAESIMWFFFERYRARFSLGKRDWCGYFCGRTVVPSKSSTPPFWRFNYFGKQVLYSNYHLSSGTVQFYIDSLNRYQPSWIHGYPSFLNLLVSLATEKKLALNYTPKHVTFGSESLSREVKSCVEVFFGCTSSELYCQTEGVAMISSCESGSLHVDEEFSYVEFKETEQQGVYEIVGTSFFNDSFQFVKYRTGDFVTLADTKCTCGRESRVVETIDGRKEDYIILENGSKVGRLDHIFKDMTNVTEAQIYQNNTGFIEFRIVKNTKYSLIDENKLKAEIISRLGKSLNFDIVYLKQIKRTKNGKLRFVIHEK
ncbi:hypothetical protein WNY63_13315 [Pseudoalteromonas neustonica]|uniref:Phenylacetate--CoA ligase family protein n=1 Tax=Pseudoalteromonas neustonica TaxID=1840331 RepID=A0ABU9U3T4_9GAMM